MAALGLLWPAALDAQVFRAEFTNIVVEVGPKDWSYVDQPGWQSADSVQPIIIPLVEYEDDEQRWYYRYRLINGPGAVQDLKEMWMYTLDVDKAAGPDNWHTVSTNTRPDNLASIGWLAKLPDVPITEVEGWPPSAYQIPPGDTLSGFVYTSLFAPAHVARVHAQGHVDVPFSGGRYITPTSDENSAMTYTIGPSIVGVFLPPIIPDDEPEAAESLLLAELAPVPEEAKDIPAEQLPPVLALRFIAEGGQVETSTLEVTLNGQDVTHLFHPAGPGLEDILIGVFSPLTVPLQEGTNTVSARVEGVPVGGTGPIADIDQFTFEVAKLRW